MNRRDTFFIGAVAMLFAATLARGAPEASGDWAGAEFFEKKIRPLLVDNCYNCHSANTNSKGGLRVDDPNGLRGGGNRGPALVPGRPEQSLLIRAVSYQDPKLQMPPKKQLSPEQVGLLTQWIKDGAVWPQIVIPLSDFTKRNPRYEALRKNHWAWQPLKKTDAPAVKNAAWARDDIDRFVLAGLEARGLSPVADASRADLLRRVTFDLTGLPPTPEAVDSFVQDAAPRAYERRVDALLASPAFGERWGRHWLDVARYGESTGPSRNIPYPNAWRYRDYVIDAFNSDKPYDQFVTEQIAGDLLPAGSNAERDRHLIATGFLAIGVKDVNQRFKVRFVMDNIDEQIDAVSRSFLAVTASCARCHDHKFDPVPQADYYALAGIFHSTDNCAGVRNKMGGGGLDYYDTSMLVRLSTSPATTRPAYAPAELERLKADLDKARAEFQAIRGTPEGLAKGPDGFPRQRKFRLKFQELQARYESSNDPAAGSDIAIGVRDSATIGDTEIRLRGEAEKLGPVVPRGFLSILQWPREPKVDASHSGRLELAQWLTSENNPLTPRVMVNRVWQHLFQQGIVKTVDNFGLTGDVPSHPQLLDDLAIAFHDDHWSVKKLVRRVVLSRTYCLSSDASQANLAIDPSDRLLWRHIPRRLDAEEIRDATLASSGTLDASRPHGSPASLLKVIEVNDVGDQAAQFAADARQSVHRSVYLPLLRGWTPTSLAVFDFADQTLVTGSRDTTTVATQALYNLNDPFVRKQSLAFAQRLLVRRELDDSQRVVLAYQVALGREPTPTEVERVEQFLWEYSTSKEVQSAASPPAVDVQPRAVTPAAERGGNGGDTTRPAEPVNPDEVEQVAAPVKDVPIEAPDSKVAAWAAFCQALFGSAEFRYLK